MMLIVSADGTYQYQYHGTIHSRKVTIMAKKAAKDTRIPNQLVDDRLHELYGAMRRSLTTSIDATDVDAVARVIGASSQMTAGLTLNRKGMRDGSRSELVLRRLVLDKPLYEQALVLLVNEPLPMPTAKTTVDDDDRVPFDDGDDDDSADADDDNVSANADADDDTNDEADNDTIGIIDNNMGKMIAEEPKKLKKKKNR